MVEPRIVVPDVAGSNPVGHPNGFIPVDQLSQHTGGVIRGIALYGGRTIDSIAGKGLRLNDKPVTAITLRATTAANRQNCFWSRLTAPLLGARTETDQKDGACAASFLPS